jgi:hypothetical protein
VPPLHHFGLALPPLHLPSPTLIFSSYLRSSGESHEYLHPQPHDAVLLQTDVDRYVVEQLVRARWPLASAPEKREKVEPALRSTTR